MKKIVLSLIITLLGSMQIWSQNDVFVKEINADGSKLFYKHIETFNKNKESLIKYSELEHPQLVENAHRIMDVELTKANYLDEVKTIFCNNLSSNDLSLLYNKVRLFYTIDNEGDIYDVFFSIPLTAEQYVTEKLLERIVKLIKSIDISIDIEQYKSFYQQSGGNGSNIWTKITITHKYWENDKFCRSSGRVVPPLAARRSPTDEFKLKNIA